MRTIKILAKRIISAMNSLPLEDPRDLAARDIINQFYNKIFAKEGENMPKEIYLCGFNTKDHRKHEDFKRIFELCDDWGIKVPDEVQEYFANEVTPHPLGREIPLPLQDYSDLRTGARGYMIKVDRIPKEVDLIVTYMES